MSLRNSSFLKVVENGRGTRVNRLLDDSLADVNSEDEIGKPAIFKAVENGFYEITHTLLQNGANVDSKFNGRSLIHLAIGADHTNIVGLLLDHGANLKEKCFQMTPYEYAMDLKNHKIAKMIVDHLLSENEKLNLQDCIVCVNPREKIFAFDCGHAKLCEQCCLKIMSQNHPKCPECREEVTQYSRIFV